jgi:hypothetical protein
MRRFAQHRLRQRRGASAATSRAALKRLLAHRFPPRRRGSVLAAWNLATPAPRRVARQNNGDKII